jgi:hypothetical protein
MGRPAIRLRTGEIKPCLASPVMVERFVDRARAASPYLSSVFVVDAEIKARQATLLDVQPAAADDTSFWQEE